MTRNTRLAALAAATVMISGAFAGCKAMNNSGANRNGTTSDRRSTTSTVSDGAVTTTPTGDGVIDDIVDGMSNVWDTVSTGIDDAIDTVSTAMNGN
ncbi:MAG: hypothetical protein ACOYJY_06160 [Acutalibacteraceae bacterium]